MSMNTRKRIQAVAATVTHQGRKVHGSVAQFGTRNPTYHVRILQNRLRYARAVLAALQGAGFKARLRESIPHAGAFGAAYIQIEG